MSDMNFTWNGVSSDSHGICVMRLPDIISPGERGTPMTVPGRDGALFLPDDAREEMVLLMECYLPYEQGGAVSPMDAIRSWLRGEGVFTQSDVPDRAFRGRITDAISFEPLVPGFADRVFGVTIYCEPYQYVHPAPADIILTGSGMITNPGTAPSLPKIRIEGEGDFSLTVGGALMSFEGISGGIVVDCEAMECLNLAETQLLNASATIEQFPQLPPGSSYITKSGNITKITITPRWRYI